MYKLWASKTTNKNGPEARERALRILLDHEPDLASRRAAVVPIAGKIGCTGQTLHRLRSYGLQQTRRGSHCRSLGGRPITLTKRYFTSKADEDEF